MLSIGLFTYSTKPRGSVVHAVRLAEALVAAGHDATLYALAKPGAGFPWTPACRVELLPAGDAPPQADALVAQRVTELADGFRRTGRRHDVYHAQDCLAANALLSLRSSGVAPLVRTVHHVERFESPYLADCQARSIREADALLSVSRLTARDVLEQFGRPSRLVHNGVDRERFAVRRADLEQRLRRRYGIGPADTVVLSVGGVEPRKNSLVALRAVAGAHRTLPHLRWIVVGDHSLWDHSAYEARFEAERRALPADLQQRIVRAGTLPEHELTALYGVADVLLLPSREEGFGLCVLEAMAAGVAVIVPRRPPFTEYLDERCAVLVRGDSSEPLAAAVVQLAQDPARRRALAAAALWRSRAFTWARCAAQHAVHYRAFLRAHGRDGRPGRSSHA